MTKVKQRRTSTSRAKPGRRKKAKLRGKTQHSSVKTTKSKKKNGVAPKGGRTKADVIPRVVRIRPLDPQEKCGAGTSVERLYRVDETVGSARIAHLVFFDRHGLYCEHGRSCPAVDDVRRAHRNLDWTRKVG